jgi:hypothetical protein
MDLDLVRIYTKISYSIERFYGWSRRVASQIDAKLTKLTRRIDTSYRRTLVKHCQRYHCCAGETTSHSKRYKYWLKVLSTGSKGKESQRQHTQLRDRLRKLGILDVLN